MKAIQFIYFASDGCVESRGHRQAVPAGTLLIAEPTAAATANRADGVSCYGYTAGDLHAMRRELFDLLPKAQGESPMPQAVRALPMSTEIGEVLSYLGGAEPRALLRFLCLYCLGMDRSYFSGLLSHSLDGSREFFEFVEEHSLNAWPVSSYALKLGLSIRKLNLLFYERFGVSAKRWLMEERLARARDMLMRTSMTVTDVALHCGFSSHAHFTESFKKRYKLCPRAIRMHIQMS